MAGSKREKLFLRSYRFNERVIKFFNHLKKDSYINIYLTNLIEKDSRFKQFEKEEEQK